MNSLLQNSPLPDSSLTGLSLFFDHSTQQETGKISSDHTLEICTNSEQFNQLAGEWNSLLQDSSANSVFLTWEWVSTWWNYFYTDHSLWTVAVRNQNGELIGLAPLAIKEQKNFLGLSHRELIFLGHGAAAPDHLDFIIRHGYENTVTSLLTSSLQKENHLWDQISFQGLASGSLVISKILNDQKFPHITVEQQSCPHLPLPESWEKLKSSLSSSMRYKLGRFERRLQKDYPLITNFKQVDNVDEFMSILFELHTIAQNRKNNKGLFSDQIMKDFHTEIAQIFSKKDWLRSYTLEVGNNTIAALHCFQYNGTVSFYQSGFDLFWKKYSPGSLIMSHAIKQAIIEKNQSFDFLRGNEEYKYSWTKEVQVNLTVSIPVSFYGQFRSHLKWCGKKVKSLL